MIRRAALCLGILLGLLLGGVAFAQNAVTDADDDPYAGIIEIYEAMLERQGADPDPEIVARLEELRRAQNAPVFRAPGLGLPPIDPDLDEVITDFDVEIDVEASGDIVVTESIRVVAAGREIKRGIFRELPAYYTFLGVRRAYDYDLLSATRDGERDSVTHLRNGNAIVWRVGQQNFFLRPGPYTYRFRYRVADAVRRHETTDELYWNATGSYWNFPIDNATAIVRFPDGTTITEVNAYTGGFGSTAQNATTAVNGNVALFETTQGLRARQGLTVSASIEKGVIDPLSPEVLREFWWLRNGAAILLGAGGGALFLFYLLQWARIGRDPPRPPVFARYAPPDGYGPGAVHFIYHRGLKGMTAFTAELLGLGSKGAASIKADEGRTVITRRASTADGDGAQLLSAIIPAGERSVVMDGSPDTELFQGVQDYAALLRRKYGRDYYRRNLGWAILGIVLSIVLVAAVLNSDVSMNSPLALALLLGLAALNIVFLILLPAPTKKGSRVHSEIAGFKLYLETAEKDRINTGGPLKEQPPMMSVELYERFLPYAVALGVERNWTRYFKSVLPREAADYRPSYARGSLFDGRGIGSGIPQIGRTLDSALTSGVASAAPVSQSSSSGGGGWNSGGGGGGFSGGGGGGGGGGGW